LLIFDTLVVLRIPKARLAMRLPVLLCATVLFMVLSGRTAAAGTILYTDRAAFEAALGNFTLITFDDPVINGPHTTADDFHGFIVTYDDLVKFWFDISGLGTTDGSVTLGQTFQSGSANSLAPVTAFGFDVINTGGFTNLGLVGHIVSPSSPQFVGVISDTPLFMQLTWSSLAPSIFDDPTTTIDNLAIQTVPVPEPASGLLFALGCAALYSLNARRVRSTR